MGTTGNLLHGKRTYVVSLLLALVATIVNYVLYANTSYALPNAVTVYSMRDVDMYDKGLYIDGATKNLQELDVAKLFTGSMAPLSDESDYQFRGLTEMQLVKYLSGCYGDLDVGAAEWTDLNTDVTKTAMLNDKQILVSTGSSVCSCIDDMVTATIDQAAFASGYTFPTSPTDYTTDMTTKLLYQANAYAAAHEDAGMTAENRAIYHRDVARLCIESAPPVKTIAFEDVVPAPLYIFVGQCLLILAAMQIYDSFVSFTRKEYDQELEAEQKQRKRKIVREDLADTAEMHERLDSLTTWQWLKVFMAIAIAVVLVWLSIANYNLFGDADAKFMTFREKENRHSRVPVITLFAWITTIIAVLVTLAFEYLMLKAHSSMINGDPESKKANAIHVWGFHKNGNTAVVLKHIACDVPLIAGFTMLGLGVFAQSDITSVHTLVGCAMIVVVMGFVQHVSNVVKGLYTRICSRLDAKVVQALTMHNQEIDDSNRYQQNEQVMEQLNQAQVSSYYKLESEIRPSLQFFGYTRLYFFIIVFVGTLSLLVVAKDTNSVYGLHSMLDGQFIYFVVAFLVCNIGFDFLYELLPFMFESSSTEGMRCVIILLYVLFFAVNQIIYFSRVPTND